MMELPRPARILGLLAAADACTNQNGDSVRDFAVHCEAQLGNPMDDVSQNNAGTLNLALALFTRNSADRERKLDWLKSKGRFTAFVSPNAGLLGTAGAAASLESLRTENGQTLALPNATPAAMKAVWDIAWSAIEAANFYNCTFENSVLKAVLKHGNLPALKFLVENGLRLTDEDGFRALSYVLKRTPDVVGHLRVEQMKLLLQVPGIRADWLHPYTDVTVAMRAARGRRVDLLALLLAHNPAAASTPNKCGNTPMHDVCRSELGSCDGDRCVGGVCEALLRAGADPDAADAHGNSPQLPLVVKRKLARVAFSLVAARVRLSRRVLTRFFDLSDWLFPAVVTAKQRLQTPWWPTMPPSHWGFAVPDQLQHLPRVAVPEPMEVEEDQHAAGGAASP
jgi:hypothetical protein